MMARRIFKKRKSNRKIFFVSLFFLCILFFLIYYSILKKENRFIVIPENTDNFYIIPKDRGGEKVQNLDKKSLNPFIPNIDLKNQEKPENLLFSIQFYVDSDFEKVNKFIKKITKSDETIYNLNDFYILSFISDIGIEYFLLYKNFSNRLDAQNYCINFLPKIDNCIVVDTTKF